jgi:hypothetical protein
MATLHSNERVLALCALITEEKDPGKFQLLVHELNDALENAERKAQLATTAHRTANVSDISPQA